MASALEEIHPQAGSGGPEPPDPKLSFVQSVLEEFARRPEARDEALAEILYYQQSLWGQLVAFQGYLTELGPGGLMKLMMGRGGK